MTWIAVCHRDRLSEGRGWPVRADGRFIAIFVDGGRLYALENRCRHVSSPIDDGAIYEGCVTCPWHGWRYELATGDLLTAFGHRPGVTAYPVREQDGRVWVDVDADEVSHPGDDGAHVAGRPRGRGSGSAERRRES